MATSGQLSLNQIIQYFAQIAAQLKRVHTFGYGPIEDITRDNPTLYNATMYPLMWVEPVPSTLRRDSIVLRHKIYIVDLINKDLTNRQDVLSDSFNTCLELKAFIFKDFFYDIFPSDESDLDPLFYKFDDEVEGYSMTLELQLDWLADVCNIPGLYPSGVTFSVGPDYYNVVLTDYLPLAGGQLTGPLSGTSANFNIYLSGGTNLYDIFSTASNSGSTVTLNPNQIAFGSPTSAVTSSPNLTWTANGLSGISAFATLEFNGPAERLRITSANGVPTFEIYNAVFNTITQIIAGGQGSRYTATDIGGFGRIYFCPEGNEEVRFSTLGSSFGTQVNPTATVDIKGSSASRPSLRIQSGVTNATITTALDGLINNDGTNLYGYVGGSWQQLNNAGGSQTLYQTLGFGNSTSGITILGQESGTTTSRINTPAVGYLSLSGGVGIFSLAEIGLRQGAAFIKQNGVAFNFAAGTAIIGSDQSFNIFEGIKYLTNYSANFVARSLIDKGYADTAYVGSGSTVFVPYSGANTTVDLNNQVLTLTGTGTADGYINLTRIGTNSSVSQPPTGVRIAGSSNGRLLISSAFDSSTRIFSGSVPSTVTYQWPKNNGRLMIGEDTTQTGPGNVIWYQNNASGIVTAGAESSAQYVVGVSAPGTSSTSYQQSANIINIRSDNSNGNIILGIGSIAQLGSSVTSFAGLQYGANYSTNYTNRSLVDKEYVTNLITGATSLSLAQVLRYSGYTSGLPIYFYSAGTAQARLDSATPGVVSIINSGSSTDNTQYLQSSSGMFMIANNVSGSTYLLIGAQAQVASTVPGFVGMEYNADYAANYTARSLVDKGFVTGYTYLQPTQIAYGNSGSGLTGDSRFLHIQSTGQVLIGNSGTTAFGNYPTDTESMVAIARTTNPAVNQNAHGFVDATYFFRNNNGRAYNSFGANVSYYGTANYDHYIPYQSNFILVDSGSTLDKHYGGYDAVDLSVGTTLTDRFIHYAVDATGAGVLTNQYGLYVPTLSKGSSKNEAIHVVSNPSFFGGEIRIATSSTASGTTTPDIGAYFNNTVKVAYITNQLNANSSEYKFYVAGISLSPTINILSLNGDNGDGSGTSTPTATFAGNVNMSSFQIKSLAPATLGTDAVNYSQLTAQTIHSGYTQAVVAATSFTVPIGQTLGSALYDVNVTPRNALSAAVFYVTNQTTTTFDVVYLAGLTGTISFSWALFR